MSVFVIKIYGFMQLCGNKINKNTILSHQVGLSSVGVTDAQTFEIVDIITSLQYVQPSLVLNWSTRGTCVRARSTFDVLYVREKYSNVPNDFVLFSNCGLNLKYFRASYS